MNNCSTLKSSAIHFSGISMAKKGVQPFMWLSEPARTFVTDLSILCRNTFPASTRATLHIDDMRWRDASSTILLRDSCSDVSSLDVVDIQPRAHVLTLQTCCTLPRSDNKVVSAPCNLFEACWSHSFSCNAIRSAGMEEEEEERSTNGLYDLRFAGRSSRCVDDGRAVRRV